MKPLDATKRDMKTGPYPHLTVTMLRKHHTTNPSKAPQSYSLSIAETALSIKFHVRLPLCKDQRTIDLKLREHQYNEK